MHMLLVLLAYVMVVLGCDGPTVYKTLPGESKEKVEKTVQTVEHLPKPILLNEEFPFKTLPSHLMPTRYHEFPKGGLPENTEVEFACCEEGGCKFYLVFYHCPGCSTPTDGHFPSLEQAGWEPSGCSPRFEDLYWGHHPTLTMMIEMEYNGEPIKINTGDRQARFIGVFSVGIVECLPYECYKPYSTGTDMKHCSHHCCGDMHPQVPIPEPEPEPVPEPQPEPEPEPEPEPQPEPEPVPDPYYR